MPCIHDAPALPTETQFHYTDATDKPHLIRKFVGGKKNPDPPKQPFAERSADYAEKWTVNSLKTRERMKSEAHRAYVSPSQQVCAGGCSDAGRGQTMPLPPCPMKAAGVLCGTTGCPVPCGLCDLLDGVRAWGRGGLVECVCGGGGLRDDAGVGILWVLCTWNACSTPHNCIFLPPSPASADRRPIQAFPDREVRRALSTTCACDVGRSTTGPGAALQWQAFGPWFCK